MFFSLAPKKWLIKGETPPRYRVSCNMLAVQTCRTVAGKKILPLLPAQILKCTSLGLGSSLRGEKPVSNCLSYGTIITSVVWILKRRLVILADIFRALLQYFQTNAGKVNWFLLGLFALLIQLQFWIRWVNNHKECSLQARSWEAVVVAHLMALSQYSVEETEEHHENPGAGYSRFEPGTSRAQVQPSSVSPPTYHSESSTVYALHIWSSVVKWIDRHTTVSWGELTALGILTRHQTFCDSFLTVNAVNPMKKRQAG
jgi:hypothetical protein